MKSAALITIVLVAAGVGCKGQPPETEEQLQRRGGACLQAVPGLLRRRRGRRLSSHRGAPRKGHGATRNPGGAQVASSARHQHVRFHVWVVRNPRRRRELFTAAEHPELARVCAVSGALRQQLLADSKKDADQGCPGGLLRRRLPARDPDRRYHGRHLRRTPEDARRSCSATGAQRQRASRGRSFLHRFPARSTARFPASAGPACGAGSRPRRAGTPRRGRSRSACPS